MYNQGSIKPHRLKQGESTFLFSAPGISKDRYFLDNSEASPGCSSGKERHVDGDKFRAKVEWH